MESLVARALGVVAAAGVALTVAAAPAAAAVDNTFELAAGSATAYGTYDLMMSNPEQPLPPIAVSGTLTVNARNRCGVVQIAYNGPADGLEWRTFGQLCKAGKTNFRTRSSYMFGGFKPQVRLCAGATVAQAERGRHCDVYTPAGDR